MFISTRERYRVETPAHIEVPQITTDLLTKAEVKNHLNLGSSETQDDTYLEHLIDVVSAAIEKGLNRRVRQRSNVAYWFKGEAGRFRIESDIVRAFVSISIYNGGIETADRSYYKTFTATPTATYLKTIQHGVNSSSSHDWPGGATIEPVPNNEDWIDYASQSDLFYPVKILANTGFSTIPTAIKHVCLQVIADLFDYRGQLTSGMVSDSVSRSLASSLLDSYRFSRSGMFL